MSISLRRALRRRVDQASPTSLRGQLERGFDQTRVSGSSGRVRIITYNTAMLPLLFAKTPPPRFRPGLKSDPARRKAVFRDAVIATLIREILRSGADLIGLCEAFGDEDRDRIARGVRSVFPSRHEGPDEPSLEEDGGLLLLGRTPFIVRKQSIFRTVAGHDGFSEKGLLHVTTRPTGAPGPIDLLFAHAQALELRFRSGSHQSVAPAQHVALAKQLQQINLYRLAECNPETPTVVLGDLNFPHTNPLIYGPFMGQLGGPRDLWLATHRPDADGDTESSRNQFEGAPKAGQGSRLDYVLDYPGRTQRLVPSSARLLRWQRSGVDISDHFGVQVDFDGLLDTRGTMARRAIVGITARILSVHCIEVSAPHHQPDEVRFRLSVQQVGASARTTTYPSMRIDSGMSRLPDPRRRIRLTGDAPSGVRLTVSAVEVDSLSADDPLGTASRIVGPSELSHISATGGVRDIVMPRQTRDGEYVATVRLRVT